MPEREPVAFLDDEPGRDRLAQRRHDRRGRQVEQGGELVGGEPAAEHGPHPEGVLRAARQPRQMLADRVAEPERHPGPGQPGLAVGHRDQVLLEQAADQKDPAGQLKAAAALLRSQTPAAAELGELFARAGHELALVGGSVRDVFLGGHPGGDLDMTTDAVPEQVLEIVSGWADKTWTVGIDFGTVGLRKGNDIFVANKDGGQERRLLTAAGTPSYLRWSPDGSILRFTVNDPRTNVRLIWQASADGSNLHALLPDWTGASNECCGSWTPDGKYFVFQATGDATTNLWAIPERAGFLSSNSAPTQLTTGPMNVGAPVPSTDGKRLFVQGWQPRGELVRYDPRSSQFVPYLDGVSAMGLDFSRDGQWMAYNDATDGTLRRSKVDGSQKLQLVFPPMVAYLPRWSPDGKQIAFIGHPPGEHFQIYLISAEGGSPELLYHSDTNLADPNWSPDGKSLAFGENSLNNQGSAIYILDLKTRVATKLPGSDGLYSPRWSPNGRYIAAIPLDSLKLMLFDRTTQKWSELAKIFVSYPTWSRDGRYIYFDGTLDNKESFFRVPVSGGKPERLFSLDGFQAAGGAFGNWSGLAPDGTPLVVRDASIQEIYALDWDAH